MEGQAYYFELLKEKTANLLVELRNLRSEFLSLGDSTEKRLELIQTYKKRYLEHFEAIEKFTAQKTRPQWVIDLSELKDLLPSGKNQNEDLNYFERISHVIQVIKNFNWETNNKQNSNSEVIDFSGIFQECLEGSRILPLFEEVEKILIKIIESGEIDSIKIIGSLKNLIATVKLNQKKDAFSLYYTKEFLSAFLQNAIIEELRTLPVVGPLITAYEMTMREINEEWTKVSVEVQGKVVARAKVVTPAITYQAKGGLFLLPQGSSHDLKA